MAHVTLPQLAEITGWTLEKTRLFAETYAGPPTARPYRGALVLTWPVTPICDLLARRGVKHLAPGGWCLRPLVHRLLTQHSKALYNTVLRSHLIRHSRGRTAAGTPCMLYSLADLLAIHRHPTTISHD